jgi:PAS domain S-box-containing protein
MRRLVLSRQTLTDNQTVKILIAEDNIVSRTLLRATLRNWGYEVDSVTDGIEALTSLQSEDAPPLAILDVEMPGMDGTEVCKRLRKMKRPTPTYIILLTANADKAAAVAGLEAGADDYVTKPFDPGELRARVQVGARMVELQGSRAKYIKVLEDTFTQLESNSATLTQLNGKMLEEISERRRAEEELRLQKVLLESQSEASLDGVLVISPEGKIISVNHQFIEIWGLSDDVLATKSGAGALQTIADNLDDPGKFLDLGDCSTAEKSDHELTLKDGRILHYYSAPARSPDGVYYGRASYFRDITERKRVEKEIRKSDERYRDLVENARDIIYTHDLQGNYTSTNRASEEITGYTREEILHLNVTDLIAPEDWQMVSSMLAGKLDGENETIYDLEIIAKDGRRIAVEVNTRLIFQGDAPIGVQGIARDVTERMRMEGQLRQSQKMESIGQLAAGIAHEINTPTQYVGDNLRFIQEAYQTQTQLMEEYSRLFAAAQLGPISPELLNGVGKVIEQADLEYVALEVPKALQQSLEGIERIAKIVQSIKDFAHPDAAEKKAIDLNRAIESTINVARGEWKYVAQMETDFDPNLPLVPCLLGELNQMTLNLIINSSHAIAAKMKTAEQGMGVIRITTRREEDWAVMRISDTGEGIPRAVHSRIFDPFFTTKEVGKGTGQGLAISHTVVEKHGGTITFETAEGEGTTFIIRLPLHETEKMPGGLKEAA